MSHTKTVNSKFYSCYIVYIDLMTTENQCREYQKPVTMLMTTWEISVSSPFSFKKRLANSKRIYYSLIKIDMSMIR